VSLLSVIREHIQADGPLNVAAYMEFVLQDPIYGYYRRGDRLGRSGDFITAPEVSQMFGEMIGLWVAEVWRLAGSQTPFTLLELGPGRGTLMQDALRATHKIKGFHASMELHLLESNQTFRAQQLEKLDAYNPRHIDDLSQLPEQPLFIIANEFFDALPIRQFIKSGDVWGEHFVDIHNDLLCLVSKPIDLAVDKFILAQKQNGPDGTVIEVSIPSLLMMRDIAGRIAANGGAALVIDYGYGEPSGQSTFQAVSGHQYADVLKNPGEADLTAHVDFTALRLAALSHHVQCSELVGQSEFLCNLGIELRAMQLKQNASPEQAAAIDAALHRLTDPAQMGSLFKVMAIAAPNVSALPGF
jgi:SAM-dependent MidA family methyltransferase